MNKRQKKKEFKKKYGFNPPRKSTTYKIHMATKAVVKIWNVIKSILVRIGKAIEQVFARLSEKWKLMRIEQFNKGHIVPTQPGIKEEYRKIQTFETERAHNRKGAAGINRTAASQSGT